MLFNVNINVHTCCYSVVLTAINSQIATSFAIAKDNENYNIKMYINRKIKINYRLMLLVVIRGKKEKKLIVSLEISFYCYFVRIEVIHSIIGAIKLFTIFYCIFKNKLQTLSAKFYFQYLFFNLKSAFTYIFYTCQR